MQTIIAMQIHVYVLYTKQSVLVVYFPQTLIIGEVYILVQLLQLKPHRWHNV